MQSLDTEISSVGSPEEYFTVATANSFEELKEIMPRLEVPKGERVRFVMELNLPVAPLFDLAGAEFIFEAVMPEGLTLIDVYGEGWRTAVIECEADPVWLPAVGAFLLLHWKALSLLAIGIMLALGFLILTIRVDVTKAVEVAPEVLKWLAIGLFGVATVGGVVYLFWKPKKGVT